MRNFHFPGRSPVYATNGMVATSHPLAASEALAVLKSGGNAADAAIAGAVLLGVCEPQMTGLGGDCFALIKPAGSTSDIVALNGSGRAPKNSDPQALRDAGHSKIENNHAAAVTVPGAVDAFCQLSERFGKLGLDASLAPAIKYFEEGVPIAPRVASDIGPVTASLSPAAKKVFSQNGHALGIGAHLRLPGQAEVLRRIAKDGRDAFYEGEIADDMLNTLHTLGGVHTTEDFATTRSSWGSPVSGAYRTKQLIEHPPNGQGAIAILLAGILNQFDIASLDPNGVERFHLEAEATKLAYDARNRFLADGDHMDRLDHLLAPETAIALSGLIDPKRAMASPAALSEDVHRDTILITVVDRDGMAVSLIYSIFSTFGSGQASDKFGILLHNRGAGFNLTSGHPNELGGGKRPMHTIIPAMTSTNGTVDMAFGVMGGQYQATGHAHLMSNLLDFGMDPQQAIDAPRAFADPQSGKLHIEDTLSEATCAGLTALGHELHRPDTAIGGAQAIAIDASRGMLTGGSDPRKDGLAIGY
ncbi:MAG: gamma-glutamyltransferase family protein [Paracoccaceae bacterium]